MKILTKRTAFYSIYGFLTLFFLIVLISIKVAVDISNALEKITLQVVLNEQKKVIYQLDEMSFSKSNLFSIYIRSQKSHTFKEKSNGDIVYCYLHISWHLYPFRVERTIELIYPKDERYK